MMVNYRKYNINYRIEIFRNFFKCLIILKTLIVSKNYINHKIANKLINYCINIRKNKIVIK